MFVIRLPNGNLMAPESAMDRDSRVVGDAYVEVAPADLEYARLARQAGSEQAADDRHRRRRAGDEARRRGCARVPAGGARARRDRPG